MTNISPSTIIKSLIMDGREDDALKMCRDLGIDTPEIYCDALDLLENRGDRHRFLSLSEIGSQVFPNHAGVITRHVTALLSGNETTRAAHVIERFIERNDDHGLWAMLAESYMLSGQSEKAGEVLQRYMPANPGNASAWILTAKMIHLYGHPNLAGIMSGLEYEISTVEIEVDENSGRLHFAHGLMLESLGRFDEAILAFSRGNKILNDIHMAHQDEMKSLIIGLKEAFTKEWISDRQIFRKNDVDPIFVAGSLHAGREDVREAILTDPDIFDAGDMRMLERDLHMRFGDPWEPGYASGLKSLTKEDISSLRERYLDAMNVAQARGKRCVDAASLNILHLPILKAMFPQARFVVTDCDTDIRVMKSFRSPDKINTHRLSADLEKIHQNIACERYLSSYWRELIGDDFIHLTWRMDGDIPDLVANAMTDLNLSQVDFDVDRMWPDLPVGAIEVYRTALRLPGQDKSTRKT